MAVFASDRKFFLVNQACHELLGYSEQELLGKTFIDITHPEGRKAADRRMRQLASGKDRSIHVEKRHLHKDGRVIWVLLGVAPVRDAAGRLKYTVSQYQDITERKEAEEPTLPRRSRSRKSNRPSRR